MVPGPMPAGWLHRGSNNSARRGPHRSFDEIIGIHRADIAGPSAFVDLTARRTVYEFSLHFEERSNNA